MNQKKVEIIVSTYNGEKYIEEQIESLLNQSYENFSIIIRDDGSTDNTLEVLAKYKENKKIKIYKCKNVGVVRSFFELLDFSSEDAEYISFCDQDDVWKSDKIEKAVKYLNKEAREKPLLYCSRQMLVDDKLQKISISPLPKKSLTLENALVENIATGCTCVINKAMKNKITNTDVSNIIMHDWLLYLVATSFGTVIFDAEPRMYYRQHSNNVVGSTTNISIKWKTRIKRFKKEKGQKKLRIQAERFKNNYPDLDDNQKELISKFVNRKSIKDSIVFLFKYKCFRQSSIDNIVFKILISLNII